MWGDISMSFIFAFIWWLVRFRLCSSSFLTPSHADHLSILDGAREKWVFWSASHTVGKPDTHILSLPPSGKFQARGSLLALSCTVFCWVDMSKVKLYFLLSYMYPTSDFFFPPMVCWNFLAVPLDFWEVFLFVSDCQTGVLWGEEDRNLLSSSPCWCHFTILINQGKKK